MEIPKKIVNFRPPSRGLKKYRLSLYSIRTDRGCIRKSSKIVADFWENYAREITRTLCVQPD